MIAPALVSLLIPVLIGLVIVLLFWPKQSSVRLHLAIKVFLSPGIGFGVFSCFFFIWLLIFGPSSSGLLATLAILLVLMTALLIQRIRKLRHSSHLEIENRSLQRGRFRWVVAALFCFSLAFGLASFALIALKRPHGDWDAWAIWNLRAKFLFKGGDQWTNAFSSLLEKSRPDYPLLIPGTIGGLWTSIGSDTVLIPVLLSFIFTFATVGLAVSSLSVLRGRTQAFLAGVLLLGTPFLITHGAAQYADVPLGFFFLATLVLLALQDRLPANNYNFLVFAGVTAGLAAWTKNEGLLFIAAIAIGRLLVIAPVKGWKYYLKQMLWFGAGVMPLLVIILYFKTRLAPPNYLISQGSQTTVEKLMDASRHLQVWDAFAKEILAFGAWAVSIPLLLIFYVLLLGMRMEESDKPGTLASLVILVIMIVAYAFTFVVTPFDISWQLGTSLNRLFLQLWPGFLFVYFMMVRNIEYAVAEYDTQSADLVSP